MGGDGWGPPARPQRRPRPRLADLLRERGVDRITVVGLALDVCVKNTVLDATRMGFDVRVDTSGSRAVDVEPGDGERAVEEMRRAGATVV